MIKAIFFDLYETLITEWTNDKKKAPYTHEELGVDEMIFKSEWQSHRMKRMTGEIPDHLSALREILQGLDHPIDEEKLNIIQQKRLRAKAMPFEEMHPEVMRTLEELKGFDIKLGLISNCASEEVAAWQTCVLPKYFDDVVFSFKEKVAKPEHGIYQAACKHLNVTPKEALFIGDGGSNELEGAKQLGMKAYQATWFLPKWKKPNQNFPQLTSPGQVVDLIKNIE